LDAVAAGVLGPVHGHVGVPQQRGGGGGHHGGAVRAALVGVGEGSRQGDPDAGRDDHPLAGPDRDRRSDRLPQPAGEGQGPVGVAHVLGQDDELVAPEAGHGVGRPHDPLEAAGHLDEQVVADGMAEGIVQHLEAVEVEEQHRHRPRPAPGPGQCLAQLVHEQAAVGQPRQRIVQGAVQRPPERGFGRECQRATAAVTGQSVRHMRVRENGPEGLVIPAQEPPKRASLPGPDGRKKMESSRNG
jgi:hypothetical protein